MRKKLMISGLGLGGLLAISGAALALSFHATPKRYDPGHTNTVVSEWVPRLGQPDNSGNLRYGLLLSKNTSTDTNSSATVSIKNSPSKPFALTQVGYDIRNNSHCGAGAPRFDITAADGTTYFIGCNSNDTQPTTVTTTDGWQTRTWGGSSGQAIMADTPSNGFSAPVNIQGLMVKSIDIVFDEGTDSSGGPDSSGVAILDNLNVNGMVMGQPGTSEDTSSSSD